MQVIQMATKDGSNGVWRDDTEGLCSILSLLRFMSLLNKRLGGPGNTKVRGFRHCAKILNSQ